MRHFITDIQEMGKIITLSDGARYQISAFHSMDTMIWLKGDMVTTDGFSITNHNQNNKTVDARRII